MKYRPEIDGLRAVAVMVVVLFHAGFGCPGGYVGVDVFFVISGFLITKILLKDLEAGTFSFAEFWARRIRRILPAVAVMVLCVLGVGYFVLDSSSYTGVATSSVYQSTMLANIYFWRAWGGYFSESADLRPLLHTWSLAVEEQFYIFSPFILWAIFRWRRWRQIGLLVLVGLISLVWSVLWVQSEPMAAFFLLPPRAWELMVGAIIAVLQGRIRIEPRVASVATALGLAAVLYPVFWYSPATSFPGLAAIPPVLGAAIFILASEGSKSLPVRILSSRPVVFVGLISYSLYLWHWPFLSFADHTILHQNQTVLVRTALVAGAVGVAVLSWWLIENPFRKSRLLRRPSVSIAFGLVLTMIVGGLSVGIWRAEGFPGRASQSTQLMWEDIHWSGAELVPNEGTEPTVLGSENKSVADASPDFVVWGDSHARMLSAVVDSAAKHHDLSGHFFWSSGNIPLPKLWRAGRSEQRNQQAVQAADQILKHIESCGTKNLILVGRWAGYVEGENPMVLDDLNPTHHLVSDSPAMVGSVTVEESRESVARQLNIFVENMSGLGIQVWVLGPVPEAVSESSARDFYIARRFNYINKMPERHTISVEDHLSRIGAVPKILDRVKKTGAHVIDPMDVFFENSMSRLEIYSDRSHYRDDDHLTGYGAAKYLGGIVDEMFKEIAGVVRVGQVLEVDRVVAEETNLVSTNPSTSD